MVSLRILAGKAVQLLPYGDSPISAGKQPRGLSSRFNYSTGLSLLTNLVETSYENHRRPYAGLISLCAVSPAWVWLPIHLNINCSSITWHNRGGEGSRGRGWGRACGGWCSTSASAVITEPREDPDARPRSWALQANIPGNLLQLALVQFPNSPLASPGMLGWAVYAEGIS